MSRKPPRIPGDIAPPVDTESAEPLHSELPVDPPNAIDVDPSDITAPVLTKQGWVVPVDQKNPNAPR